MGAAQSQDTYSDIRLDHPYLRNCRALNRSKLTFLLASLPTQRPQFEQWKEQISAFQQTAPDCQALLLPLKHRFEEGGVCSTAGELTIQYDYYPRLLSTEISERSLTKARFTEAELWYLLYVLASARDILTTHGLEIGDIQPRNIFLNSEQQAKVASIISWPGQVSAYRRAVLEEDIGYLAPEDMERLKLGAMDNKANTQAQIFAIGLTLLSASLLQPMKDLYRIRDKEFDEQLFTVRLAVFQQDRGFSDIYRAVVSNLLELDPMKRMSQQDLGQLLFKHRENLLNRKSLLIDNVGKKLQQTINILLRIVPHPQAAGNQLSPRGASPAIPSLYGPSRRNNQLKETDQHSAIQPEPNQKSMRQSNQKFGDKIKSYENGSATIQPAHLPVSPRQNNKFGPLSPVPIPIPLPKYPQMAAPLRSTFTYNDPLKQAQNIPNFHKPSQPLAFKKGHPQGQTNSPRYKPFQFIHKPDGLLTVKEVVFPLREESGTLKEGASAGDSEVQGHSGLNSKSLVDPLNLLGETRQDGFNLVQYCKVERKNAKLTNPSQQQIQLLHNQKSTEAAILKKQLEQTSNTRKQPEYRQDGKTLLRQRQNLKKQSEQKQIKKQQQNEILQRTSLPEQKQNISSKKEDGQLQQQDAKQKSKQPSIVVENQTQNATDYNPTAHFQNNNQHPNQSKQSVGSIPIQSADRIPANEPVQTVISEEVMAKLPEGYGKMSPMIKVWGMQKGQLTVQQVRSTPALQATPPNTVTQRVLQKSSISTPIATPTLAPQRQNLSQPSSQNLSSQNYIPQKKTSQNYILIEEASRMSQKDSAIKQLQSSHQPSVQPQPQQTITIELSNTDDKPKNQIIKSHSSSRSQTQKRIDERFMYVHTSTVGSFEECWKELQRMLELPVEYSSKVNPEKVLPRQTEYGKFLRIGPGMVKIDTNKEQGKVWLQNIYGSLCQGEVLCGVLKGEDRRHYIWFNSSYTYKGKHFPSKEILEEALQVARKNIQHRKTSPH